MTEVAASSVAQKKLTKRERETLRGKYGGCCAYCGNPLGARWHADHIDPVMRRSTWVKGKGLVPTGEMDWPERDAVHQMNPACAPCNLYKGALSLESWRTAIEHLNDLLLRDSGPFRHALRFGLVKEARRSVVFHFERLAMDDSKAPQPPA